MELASAGSFCLQAFKPIGINNDKRQQNYPDELRLLYMHIVATITIYSFCYIYSCVRLDEQRSISFSKSYMLNLFLYY